MNAPQQIQMLDEAPAAQVDPAPRAAALPAVQANRAPAVVTPADLLRVALDQNVDLDRLEKLYALQQRWEQDQARKAFNAAMTAFKAEPLTIFKAKAVGFTAKDGSFVGYKHAELSDVADVVVPAMSRHGLSHRWVEKVEGKVVTCTCVVRHELGHEEEQSLPGPFDDSGKKNAIQQMASTITYLRRYTLLGILGMSTKDEDDDGAGGGDAEGVDPLLQGFKDASLEGTDALRAHYDKVQPEDGWWAKNGRALKAAAAVADKRGAA